MGTCTAGKPCRQAQEAMTKFGPVLTEGQIYILHLMYLDLAERIVDSKVNLENFLLFFHKNRYWGERLFQEFDHDDTRLISEPEFISGISRIFKTSQKQKISLLFKFFSHGGQHNNQGVGFHNFLTMLYNYPKEDLRQILNDKQFIEYELKTHLVPITTKESAEQNGISLYSLESTTDVKQYLPSENSVTKIDVLNRRLSKKFSVNTKLPQKQNDQMPSMIGREVARALKNKQGNSEPVIKLNYEDQTLNIKAINIQQIVKVFAQKIFREAQIDTKTGRLNFQEFYSWICRHKALYENYYDGFHNQVWERDHKTSKPMYLTTKCEKSSEAKALIAQKVENVRLSLHQSILVACKSNRLERPFMIVCLDGLAVRRIFEESMGFGIQISHRDGLYPQKRFFFKNQDLLLEWMHELQSYKGDSLQNRYQIGQSIGRGKFSVVYKCTSLQNDEEYALKQIQSYKLDQEMLSLIAHESSIMQVFSHPLLVDFKESIKTKTHIYIITELVKGVDLFQYVRRHNRLQQREAAQLCQQIIVGVRFLHSFEIIHRDLKPENIMVVLDEKFKAERIKIIDFGLSNYHSKLQNNSNHCDNMVGTPNYIAPEILKQHPFDFKIDNFAIGVILYFMLTGKLPFCNIDISETLRNIMMGQYQFQKDVQLSLEARDITQKLLRNDPSDRISLQEAIQHPWFNILGPRKNCHH